MTIMLGDCLDLMKTFPDNHFTSVVTDPPYGLNFMGKDWDGVVPSVEYWKEALRVTAPGGHILAFGGTRTYHRLACAIEDAGWEIRDCLMWLYGSGFPKSLDISKAADKLEGKQRARTEIPAKRSVLHGDRPCMHDENYKFEDKNPISELAKQFNGYGTALKPAYEPILLGMKPLDGTFAQNAEKWGVAGLNIDSTRVFSAQNELNQDFSISDTFSFSCLEKVRNLLFDISFALRSCSSFDINHLHNVHDQYGKKLSDEQCGIFLNHLFPNGAWCVPNWSSIPNFQSDCLVYRRLRDELIPNALKNAQVSAPLLGDALFCIYLELFSPSNNHLKDTVRLSIVDVLALVCALIKPLVNPILYSPQTKKTTARWPANLILNEAAGQMLDEQSGFSKSPKETKEGNKPRDRVAVFGDYSQNNRVIQGHNDSGGASRFFYCPKTSTRERNEGLDNMALKENSGCYGEFAGDGRGRQTEHTPMQNNHPTVKPLSLLKYLITLIAPPKCALILDPFAGSGTTILAAKQLGIEAIGMEKSVEYALIAQARVDAQKPPQCNLNFDS